MTTHSEQPASPQGPETKTPAHGKPRPHKPRKKTHQSTSSRATAEQCQHARQWLERLGLPVTDQQVHQLARYADRYRPDSAWSRIADAMVRNGEEPKPDLVRARYEARKQAAARRRERRVQQMLAEGARTEPAPEQVAALQQWLVAYHAEHGHGPSWAETRGHMGWSRFEVEVILRALRRRGEVTFTEEPGSLAVAQPR